MSPHPDFVQGESKVFFNYPLYFPDSMNFRASLHEWDSMFKYRNWF